MIQPDELKGTQPVTLPGGDITTREDIWSMLSASRNGNLDQLKELVSRCPGLVRCQYNYTPPIHFAVREGYLEIVRYLLDRGADTTYNTYPFKDSLLTMARDRGHHKIAQLLLEVLSRKFPVVEGLSDFHGAAHHGDLMRINSELKRDPSLAYASNDTGETALHKATEGGRFNVMMALLDAGANVDAVRADGVRPINLALRLRDHTAMYAGVLTGALLARGAEYNIYVAAVLGDMEYVREALARDSALSNFEDSSHFRPISAAARRNDLEMVKLLLDHGADPSLPEEGAPQGQSLWIAVYQKQREMVELLLERGANPNTSPESSGSALFQAREDPELTRLLIAAGARDDSTDMDELQRMVDDNALAEVEAMLLQGGSLEHQSLAFWNEGILAGPARSGHREMIELLIRHGARVPDTSKWGRFYYFKHYEIAALLLENGMNPNHMNWHHVTLLHDMAQEGDIPKARLLLDHGADVNAIDEEYRSTPLGFAARWGQREMTALLLEHGADPNLAGAPWATPLAWARIKGNAAIEADLLQIGVQEEGDNGITRNEQPG